MSKLEDRKVGEVVELNGKISVVVSEYKETVLSDEEYEKVREQKAAEIANLEAYILKTKQEYNI